MDLKDMQREKPLQGKVAVVAGATRGAGRGIAVMLGAAGATVYCTGRSVRGQASDIGRSETIDDTAEMVTARGGKGIAVRTDHTSEEQVQALFARVEEQQEGRLDILVNDIWGGENLTHWNTPFWEQPLADGLLMQERAVKAHLITSYYGVPLMVKRREGLVIEITDGSTYNYRGNLYYSLAKISPIHLAAAMAEELRPYNVTALAVTPGFLRSEQMLDYFGVAESNWRDAIQKEPHYAESETPYFVGQAVAALAADPQVAAKAGKSLTSWDLSDEYGFADIDGRKPHWGNYARRQGLPVN
ncbi:SDR family oxidoreductase [Paenibacillus macerans]|uniref:Short chain dehydrogenase family protein n=1 Tax=Paenibacillus macerans TaxID=44252 RepID=A0A090ZEN5_PAEMA|nr:SDR family oxidoreductase [Paenibacillus macerans]KFN08680.1 short chain dehydrogenase family protein [Paenibacillus macerans]MCY7559038.1 SDR family oxidoreductase [Paenibacillus macerans]MEC0152720.1 SDR family oxidoreductase [Paenibacillus macerans]MEC0328793.1 SDR family oxidoreductase [Paenibacillus macerans]SUD26089.1 short-chain dehydrogenase/reductase SDR [Paenibacillus macerans]